MIFYFPKEVSWGLASFKINNRLLMADSFVEDCGLLSKFSL